VVEVEDSGAGITASDLEKIFHPFYSTKPATGVGLGLSECRRIVHQYAGRIEVESTVGEGSLFRVFLPGRRMSSPGR